MQIKLTYKLVESCLPECRGCAFNGAIECPEKETGHLLCMQKEGNWIFQLEGEEIEDEV